MARRSADGIRFDAIVVPTNRRVGSLTACMQLARETRVPLVVVCSKLVSQHRVIEMATSIGVAAYALDLPPYPASPLGITFATSTDDELATASSARTRDLGTKRNLGLVLARMLDWKQLMFLDDDIYGVSKDDVEALGAALDNHNVSVLIPDYYPDNSVACHAFRLGGGEQGKFAGAGAMSVRCDRGDLPFFPNIYNEDWFFFSEEAATRKITVIGSSRQRKYNPFMDPNRAVKEEFGDLLAEGLYTRLDAQLGISDVNVAYWRDFKASRRDFLNRVARSLTAHPASGLDNDSGRSVRAAQLSIRAAKDQLERISPELCQKFIDLWHADLIEWRHYLANLPCLKSVGGALEHLGLGYAESHSPSTL